MIERDLPSLSPEEREVSAVMMRAMDDFTRELRLSINYYQTHYQDIAEQTSIDEVPSLVVAACCRTWTPT